MALLSSLDNIISLAWIDIPRKNIRNMCRQTNAKFADAYIMYGAAQENGAVA